MTKDEKDRVIKRAGELAGQYVPVYWGCGQSTFSAIVDALREFGIELCTKQDEEEIFKGLVGLSGGYGNMGTGNCGACVGATFAVSLFSGIGREEQLKDKDHRRITFDNVAGTIGERFLKEFGGHSCRDVTWKRFGKQYDSWNPASKKEFARDEEERGCIGEENCTQPIVARWATEYILDLTENPLTLEKVKEKYGEVH
ncbi:MAG: C_GCAxxG_C_C family protein [Deltaproteobacteria bacterium]|nr:C_GCAxxG_C_C family protein [Deltaproteobacteria bacterium]